MQKLRVGEQVRISFEKSGDTRDLEVAPLLFLPLVENGFKHGVKGETEGAFIAVSCNLNARHLVFKVENNKGQIDEVEKAGFNGVGLQNLRRRLDLIYPGKYELMITDGIKVYTTILKLDLT